MLRGLRQKLDALRLQNGQSLSKYQGFIRKLVCYKGISIFWNYLNSRLFVCSKCTIQSRITNSQTFLTSFVIFHAFTDFFELYDPGNEKPYNELSKGWKFAWYHHFTHIECAKKLRGLRQNMDALRVQNEQSLSKYHVFIWKLVCYIGISFFWTYLNSTLCVCSKCTIQSHIINFQPFLTSSGIFHAFTDF